MKSFFIIGIMLTFLASCMTPEQHEERSLEAARNKATHELRELSEMQVGFIRFTQPEFHIMPLFNYMRTGEKTSFYSEAFSTRPSGFDRTEKRPISNRHFLAGFVWFLPNSNEVVVVTGVSDATLSDWTPLKAVHRPLRPAHPGKIEILKQAREAGLSRSEPYLGNEEAELKMRHKLRFEAPEVYAKKTTEPDQNLTLIWRNDSDTLMGVQIHGKANQQFGKFKVEKVNYTTIPTDFSQFEKIKQFGEKKSIRIEDYQ